MGFSFPVVGDAVTVTELAVDCDPDLRLAEVEGMPSLTRDIGRNTATVALASMVEELGLRSALEVRIEKGVPMSSGMGGSAASAVGAVVALNDLLGKTCSQETLLRHALVGEAAASGGTHPDNVAPCLYGGVVVCVLGSEGRGEPTVVSMPVPEDLVCVLVHPHVEIETRAARASLRRQVELHEHVEQSACLAGFIVAMHSGDIELMQRCLRDVFIGPQRARAIPGFDAAQAAASAAGAIGCSISGSGPSVFAWGRRSQAERVRVAMVGAFEDQGQTVDSWTCGVGAQGAIVISR